MDPHRVLFCYACSTAQPRGQFPAQPRGKCNECRRRERINYHAANPDLLVKRTYARRKGSSPLVATSHAYKAWYRDLVRQANAEGVTNWSEYFSVAKAKLLATGVPAKYQNMPQVVRPPFKAGTKEYTAWYRTLLVEAKTRRVDNWPEFYKEAKLNAGQTQS